MTEWAELLAVFFLRASQMLVLAAPTFLLGVLVAGALRSLVGEMRIRRLLGGTAVPARAAGWLLALLLPVCSIGVLPIVAVLMRMGIRPGALSAMLVASGLITPWTAGYLLDQSGSSVTFGAICCNFAAAMVGGWVVDQLAAEESLEAISSSDQTECGPHSHLLATLYHAGRRIDAPMLIAIGAAGAVSGAIALLLPPNLIGEVLVDRSIRHATIASGAWLATYVNPELLAMRAGQVSMSSTMPGLTVMLLLAGASINAAVVVLAIRWFTLRAAVTWIVVVLLASAGGAWIVDRAVYDPAFNPEDSHAFEDLGRPFHLLDHRDGAWAGFVHRWKQPVGAGSIVAVGGVLVLAAGARLIRFQPAATRPMASKPLAVWVGVYLFAGGVAAALSYYPPPRAIANDLQSIVLELGQAITEQDQPATARLEGRLTHRLNQLPTAAALRLQPTPPTWARATANVRETMARLPQPTISPKDTSLSLQQAVLTLAKQIRQETQ